MEDYPYNLLIGARGTKMLELPLSLTKDVQAGIAYALSTLEDTEQNVLDQKYRLGIPLNDNQQQLEKKALQKLCYPNRWDYICYGIVGCTKKKSEEAKRKGFAQGYREGYAVGIKTPATSCEEPAVLDMMDLPIETMPLSLRVYNVLHRNGCAIVRDVAQLPKETIQKARNLGTKGIMEVVRVLHSYGLTQTQWELF